LLGTDYYGETPRARMGFAEFDHIDPVHMMRIVWLSADRSLHSIRGR
jgi:hypothetical protein